MVEAAAQKARQGNFNSTYDEDDLSALNNDGALAYQRVIVEAQRNC